MAEESRTEKHKSGPKCTTYFRTPQILHESDENSAHLTQCYSLTINATERNQAEISKEELACFSQ